MGGVGFCQRCWPALAVGIGDAVGLGGGVLVLSGKCGRLLDLVDCGERKSLVVLLETK
jgi:hypothetical protein